MPSKFFDPIVGEGAAIYHTAGALGQGERVWILAKLPGEIRVTGNDVVDKFLLLSNCHDGRTSIQIKFTPIRVVCNNTLTLALKKGAGIRIFHTADGLQKLVNANEALGVIKKGFNED